MVMLTKFGHSCVIVEADDAGKPRIALFDPGEWSTLPVENIPWIDDVFISHKHQDHFDTAKLQAILAKFPDVRITAPTEIVLALRQGGILQAADVAPMGTRLFIAPHEGHPPFLQPPEEIGVHFLNVYSHPGDSHSFNETMPILALPVQAPWGSTMDAVDLAIKLRPQYVLPVHDWHWRDEARQGMYARLEALLGEQGITFLKPVDGVPISVNL